MLDKIQSLSHLPSLVAEWRRLGKKVVQCHGVFDLLHPGHIRHLKSAKAQGDVLIVSITPDRFVNKGPGRPAFPEELRLEQLAALACVDCVVLNDTPDAVSVIRKIGPDLYVKGIEYQEHDKDVTGKISEEAHAVEAGGGAIYYTDDIVFSSSHLINRFVDEDIKRIAPFLERVKGQFSLDQLLEKVEAFSKLKVLVVGDAIIDEYQYVHPLGQSGKGVHMTARCMDKEVFLGGSFALANHLASFVQSVKLVTALGRECPLQSAIQSGLDPKVDPHFAYSNHYPTLTKRRYVLKDGESITKLFETYSSNDPLLTHEETAQVVNYLNQVAGEYDLVVICDFGNGFTNPHLVSSLSSLPAFLALNCQTNGGNRGFHVITHYTRADFISLNEPELRLAAQDRTSRLESLVEDIGGFLGCKQVAITRGVGGVEVFSAGVHEQVPALTLRAIDRVGAGDTFFALASLSASQGYTPLLTGFLGSIAAGLGVQVVGNKESVKKAAFCKYLTRLMK